MNRREFLLTTTALGLGTMARASAGPLQCRLPAPPNTPKIAQTIAQLGRTRVDDYAWLKDPNWKDVWRDPHTLDPKILKHLQAEEDYLEAVMVPEKSLEQKLFSEMALRSDSANTPPERRDGVWAYFTRFGPGADHPAYYRLRVDKNSGDELLLDCQARSAGQAFFKATNAKNSPDHKLFAWAEDIHGSERFSIRVKDLTNGEVLPDTIDGAFGPFEFSADGNWIFWVWRDNNSRSAKVFRTPSRGGKSVLVYEQSNLANLMTVTKTASGGYVMIRSWNADDSEVWLIPSGKPTSPAFVVQPREMGLVYSVEEWRDRFVILTNADGAVDFKLMWADLNKPGRENWREWIAHRPGHYIIDMLPFPAHFARIERVDANPHVLVSQIDDLSESEIRFKEMAYAVSFDGDQEYREDRLRLIYQSPRQPKTWLECDLNSGKRKTLKTQGAGANFSPNKYVVERIWVPADDGVKVPVTLLRRTDVAVNGTAPMLLYGYSSYGWTTEDAFSIPNLSLVDRGWVYGIAHARGSSDMGWDWYLQARKFHKKRTFEDFIACAEHLVSTGHAARDKIVIHGFSAGGLLVGAVANMRPDLWAGVIAQAPFVDMLNTMSDASHPLVPLTRPDWGDPLADPKAYDYIASYSPYDNVTAKAYPPVFASTSVADDRVGYWEPAKWIAKLRDKSTSGNPMMMHVDIEAGHGGGTGHLSELKMAARFYAFAITAASGKGFCR